MDLSKYDGIVCISGDGILVEVGWLVMLSSCIEFIFIEARRLDLRLIIWHFPKITSWKHSILLLEAFNIMSLE